MRQRTRTLRLLRSFCILFLLLVGIRQGPAVPTFGDIFSLRQPDGEMVGVRIWGDEFYQVVESLDGYTLIRDPKTLVICYARLSPDGSELLSTGVQVQNAYPGNLGLQPHVRIRRESQTAKVAEARARFDVGDRAVQLAVGAPPDLAPPRNGNVQALCLIVDFSDSTGTIPPANVAAFCNQVGYTGYGNNGSVRDYFYAISDGHLTYTNYVPPAYFRASHPKGYYDNPAEASGPKAQELILEALTDMEAHGFDFSQYDSNGDGLVDGINCFYAGTCSSGWAKGLWPHSWSVSFSADGVSTYKYQITDMGSSLRLGTFCHENGHMIGYWPDLYDYQYDSTGAGRFCLMAYGGGGTNPVEPCAYMKYISGWSDTTVLSGRQTALPVPAGINTLYRFPHPTLMNQYYLIENRRRTGRDANLPDAGLAIWLIDTNGSNDNQQRTPTSHYLVTLVQADGRWDLEHNVNQGDATDLWKAPTYTLCGPWTNPNTNWWDGTPSNMVISQISASGATMYFTFGPEDLTIMPGDDYQAHGQPGGPFAPSFKTYTLLNTTTTLVNWTAAATLAWLDVTPMSGSLAAGTTQTVTVSVNANAAGLPRGLFTDSLTITNATKGISQTRGVSLNVAPDHFTELFDRNDNDLSSQTLRFTPNALASSYTVCRAAATVFPVSPAGGTTLILTDDSSATVVLTGGKQVVLYGVAYPRFWVNSNGYLTFTGGDLSYSESFAGHFFRPRVSALFDDLNPGAGGIVSWKQLSDRAVVTFQNVPEYSIVGANNFQFELFFDGKVSITWLSVTATDGLAGLSRGGGLPADFAESDLTAYGGCSSGPTVVSMLRADSDPTTAAQVNFGVWFSTDVNGVDVGDFTLATSGVVGASVFNVAGGPRTFSVSVHTGSSDGTIRLDVIDNDTIVDGIGTPLGGAGLGNGDFTAGPSYHMDRTPPTAPGTPTDSGQWTNAVLVPFSWTGATDNRSPIASYDLEVGRSPGAADVFGGNVGNVLTKSVPGGLEGETFYARVRAHDAAGNIGSWSANSDGVRIDRTAPTAPGTPTDDGEFTSVTTARFFWTAGTDAGSGVGSYYLLVGSAPGWGDVFAGDVGNVLGRTVVGGPGQTLYARVHTVDRAGNTSLWSSISDGITIDTYHPRLIEATAANDQVVEVAFDEPVVNADQAANYSCTSGLSVVGVTPLSSTRYRLFTTVQQPAASYTLSVSSYVKDRAGNPIDPSARSHTFTAGALARVGSWQLYR